MDKPKTKRAIVDWTEYYYKRIEIDVPVDFKHGDVAAMFAEMTAEGRLDESSIEIVDHKEDIQDVEFVEKQ